MAQIKAVLRFAVLSAAAASCWAQAPALNAPAERTTDRAIHADHQNYRDQQARIKALNDTGRHPVASYALSKAQCWLDVSFHEYTRNDRGAFPQEALTESWKITEHLAGRGAPGTVDPSTLTPRVNGAALLRQDLWDAAARLKGHPGFRCVQQRVACAEVELVHAGNEFNQQEWRHAKPYIQLAEDGLAQAAQSAEACVPPPAAAVAPRAAPAVPAPVPFNRTATVLFNFDRHDMGNARPHGREQLDALLQELSRGTVKVQAIRLTGHADISNSTGQADYNTQLAQKRVQAVKDYLVSKGVAPALIATDGKADSQPVVACAKDKFRSEEERRECLLPNRRVDVELTGVR